MPCSLSYFFEAHLNLIWFSRSKKTKNKMKMNSFSTQVHIFPVLSDTALRYFNYSYIDRLGLLIVIAKNSLSQNTGRIVTENGQDVHLSSKAAQYS